MPNITSNRVNTVDISRCVVYRLAKTELSSTIVTLSGNNNANTTGYLVFTIDASGSTDGQWMDFKNWWKKNNNLIILGCMVKNIATSGQNKGYYWCPVNRAPGINRTDSYTNKLEFIIQRADTGIYNSDDSIYEFYFINLTH